VTMGLRAIGPAVITLGVFDGVHRGHRHLLAATTAAARDRDSASVAIVFSPHPDEVIRPGTAVARLAPPDVTLERLRETVDEVIEISFDERLRSLEAHEFLESLAPALDLRGIVMTPGSAFGRRRGGTPERVAEIGAAAGFDAIMVEPLIVLGEPVSSTRVREALAAGDVALAAELLGSAPLLRGTVVHGDRRGRELGYPTANLAFDYVPAIPALGIYTGRVHVADRAVGPGHPALVSVGVRPTFHDDGRVLVEVFLLDWDGDLYDSVLELELDARLREELRFESVEALVRQMRADEREARSRLAVSG
jgi:riboflavin kinase / FMN adenylyltransferase